MPLVLGFSLVYILRIAFSTLQKLLVLHLGTQVAYQSQRNLFRHLLSLPIRYFEARRVGDIVSRFSSFQPINEMVTGDAISPLLNGGTAIITAVLLFVYSPFLASVVLGVLAQRSTIFSTIGSQIVFSTLNAFTNLEKAVGLTLDTWKDLIAANPSLPPHT